MSRRVLQIGEILFEKKTKKKACIKQALEDQAHRQVGEILADL